MKGICIHRKFLSFLFTAPPYFQWVHELSYKVFTYAVTFSLPALYQVSSLDGKICHIHSFPELVSGTSSTSWKLCLVIRSLRYFSKDFLTLLLIWIFREYPFRLLNANSTEQWTEMEVGFYYLDRKTAFYPHWWESKDAIKSYVRK